MQFSSPMFDDVQQWFRAFAQPTVLVELGTLAVCVALAWLMVSAVRRAVHRNEPRSILFGRKVVDGVLFPLTLLGLVYVARAVVVQWVPLAAVRSHSACMRCISRSLVATSSLPGSCANASRTFRALAASLCPPAASSITPK